MSENDVTRLIAAGDWFAFSRMPDDVRLRPSTAAILTKLKESDIAFVNLEMPLTNRGTRAEKQNVLRADASVVEDLLAAGIDVVGLANNHILDYGHEGLLDTFDVLERAHLTWVGAGRNIEHSRKGAIAKGPGGTMGFLAFACTLPQGFAAAAMRPGVAPIHVTTAFVVENPGLLEQPGTPPPVLTFPLELDVQATLRAIQEVKVRADFVVVSAHWGIAGQDTVADYQREIAYALVDAGADLIVGHHPHRLQGVEMYREKPIFYSIGNFIFEPLSPDGNTPHLSFRGRSTADAVNRAMRREGVLISALTQRNQLIRLELQPLLLDARGFPALRPEMAEEFAVQLSDLSRDSRVALHVEEGQIVVTPT